jgi:hypothetical protein
MNRNIFVVVVASLLFFTILSFSYKIYAQDRFATCDACGLCPIIENDNNDITKPGGTCTIPNDPPPPGNWKACVHCLYPDLYPTTSVPQPEDCLTLKIVPDANQAPTVYPGRQYTMIGCVTSEKGFENNTGSGASSFTQALFDLIVFKMIGGIALLYLMYGAFLIITSQSDPEKLNHGKRVLLGSIIGLIFVLSTVFLVNLIGSNILKIPGFQGP